MKESIICFEVDGMKYDLDVADLTGREIGVLKRVGHVAGIGEVPSALEAGDFEVVAALTGIAMARSGQTPDYDKLLDLPLQSFALVVPEDDAERPTVGSTNSTHDHSGSLS